MSLQRIRDPIHNLISFTGDEDRPLCRLIETRPVQRLRRIKQLGFSEFVYPGATHTRFSHVLGAMQMARRMLTAFERSRAIQIGSTDHELKRRATIAAALLHDVGHGPYSHVFEELCGDFGVEKEHEAWTLEIIESPEISSILNEADLFEEVKCFFASEKLYTPYSAIISSQMDCDRLDFLCRDRYFCGLRSSFIDLEWLFDSLMIESVVVDPKNIIEKYSFVVHPKGLRVVEEFVIAYMKMYNDVYFHKTTRGVQHMVAKIIKLALTEAGETFRQHAIARFLLEESSRTLDIYLNLDDSSITSLIHEIAQKNVGDASILAQRYLDRDLFKCLEVPPKPDGEPQSQLLKKFKSKLDENGIFYVIDLVAGRSYKQYDVADKKYLENILIKQGQEHGRLHGVSKIIRSIPSQATRIYFSDDADRQRAAQLLKEAS